MATEAPYPAGQNGYVPWRVYERDRDEDRREREGARKELRDDLREIRQLIASGQDVTNKRLDDIERSDDKALGRRELWKVVAVILPIFAALTGAAAAVAALVAGG